MFRLFFAVLILGLSPNVFANSAKSSVVLRTAQFHATITEHWHDPATGESKSKVVCQYRGPVDVLDLRKSQTDDPIQSNGSCQGSLDDGHTISLGILASISLWHASPSLGADKKDLKVFQSSYWFDSAPPPPGLEGQGDLSIMMTEDLGLQNVTLWVLGSPGSGPKERSLTAYVTFQDDGK